MSWFKRRKTPPAQTPLRILRLAKMPTAIYAVGDIHGQLDLYQDLEAKIVADGAAFAGPKLVICLGDVIDRGGQTAQLLDELQKPMPAGFQRVVLRGNHEVMMLKFLEDNAANTNWLDFGGSETLASYGLSPDGESGFAGDGSNLGYKLEMAVPQAHRDFLGNLPYGLEVGDLRFAHAGYELDKPANEQDIERLTWGPPAASDAHSGPETLVHGHLVVPEVEIRQTRINLDLGAYKTGRLAAMRFRPDDSDRPILISER